MENRVVFVWRMTINQAFILKKSTLNLTLALFSESNSELRTVFEEEMSFWLIQLGTCS